MNESRAKIKYVGEFSRLKIHSLAYAAWKKEQVLIGGQTLHVCLLEYTETDHGSILAVNKFCAYTNLVKFIFKSFVSCNLQFQALYIRNSTVYRSKFRARKKPRPGQIDFPLRQETFFPSLPDGQGPRQVVCWLNFWLWFCEEKVSFKLKGNQVFRRSKLQKTTI